MARQRHRLRTGIAALTLASAGACAAVLLTEGNGHSASTYISPAQSPIQDCDGIPDCMSPSNTNLIPILARYAKGLERDYDYKDAIFDLRYARQVAQIAEESRPQNERASLKREELALSMRIERDERRLKAEFRTFVDVNVSYEYGNPGSQTNPYNTTGLFANSGISARSEWQGNGYYQFLNVPATYLNLGNQANSNIALETPTEVHSRSQLNSYFVALARGTERVIVPPGILPLDEERTKTWELLGGIFGFVGLVTIASWAYHRRFGGSGGLGGGGGGTIGRADRTESPRYDPAAADSTDAHGPGGQW